MFDDILDGIFEDKQVVVYNNNEEWDTGEEPSIWYNIPDTVWKSE